MADARQQCEWDRLLSLLAFVGGTFGSNPPRPIDMIPVRFRPGAKPLPPATPEQREQRIRRNWRYLDTFFGVDTSGG